MPCSRKMLHSTCVFQKMALKVERWNPHFTLMKCCSHSHDSKVLQLFALCEMVSCFLRLGCVCTVIQCLYVFVQFETERRSSSSIKLDLENNKDKNTVNFVYSRILIIIISKYLNLSRLKHHHSHLRVYAIPVN